MPEQLPPVAATFSADWDSTVLGVRFEEGLNRTYALHVRMLVPDIELEPGSLLGTDASVTLERDGTVREVHGIVARIEEGARPNDDEQIFTLTLVPALEALAQRKDSRIFQFKTVIQILEEVLQDALLEYDRAWDHSNLVEGDYAENEYVVQYGETDLAFAERLMAEHGIGYMFDHSGETETLVLFDSTTNFEGLTSVGNNDGVIAVAPREDVSSVDRESVAWFRLQSKLRPTVASTRVFNWHAPSTIDDDENDAASEPTMMEDRADGASITPRREMYEHDPPSTSWGYQSEPHDFSRVEKQTRLRRELHRRDALKGVGASTAVFMRPGIKIELDGHAEEDLDGDYFVTAVTHAWGTMDEGPGNDDADSSGDRSYTNRFEVRPWGFEWRPDRSRPKPRIYGVQTATVVGPASSGASPDEIHTDASGRIRVQFHWDRVGQNDDGSSCYIRVMQSWAGQNWGTVYLPRIGMEVVVTFVDGDPDRPVVTGCLYNKDNPPPFDLENDKTRSGIQTKTNGNDTYNELSFEDEQNNEEIYLRAGRNLREEVINDHTTHVMNNQTNTVDVDQTEWVKGGQKLSVGASEASETPAAGDRVVGVENNFTETVGGTETRTVTGNVTENFNAAESHHVAGDQLETVGGNVDRQVTGNVTDMITGNLTQNVTGTVSTTTPQTHTVSAAAGITMTTPAAMNVTATGGFNLTAPGGVNVVDASYWSISTTSGTFAVSTQNFFAHQLNVAIIAKNDINNILTTFNALSWTASGIDIANVAVGLNTTAVDVLQETVQVKTTSGAVVEVAAIKTVN